MVLPAAVRLGASRGRKCLGGLRRPPPGAARYRQPRTPATYPLVACGQSGRSLPQVHRLRRGHPAGKRSARSRTALSPLHWDRLRCSMLMVGNRRGSQSLVARIGEGGGW